MAIADVAEYAHLTPEEVDEIGRELDAIRAEIEESRGAADAAYINRVIRTQRWMAAAARIGMIASAPPAWISSTARSCAGAKPFPSIPPMRASAM